MEKFRRVIKAICGVVEVGDRALRRRPFKAAAEHHNEIRCWGSAGVSRGVGGGELCTDGIGGNRKREEGKLAQAQQQGERRQAQAPSLKSEEGNEAQEKGKARGQGEGRQNLIEQQGHGGASSGRRKRGYGPQGRQRVQAGAGAKASLA